MGKETLDNLFKNRLQNHGKHPSDEAWMEIQAGIGSSRNQGPWFYARIAAGIILLITIGIIYNLNKLDPDKADTRLAQRNDTELGQSTKKSNSEAFREEQTLPKDWDRDTVSDNALSEMLTKHTEEPQHPSFSVNEEDTENRGSTVTSDNQVTQKKQTSKIEEQPVDTQHETKAPALVKTVGAEEKQLVAKKTTSETTLDELQASTSVEDQNDGTKLVFDIEDFDTKKVVTAAYENAESMRKSGLKKVVDFVKNIKEGEGGLAAIREAKNNILSLNTKNNEDDGSK